MQTWGYHGKENDEESFFKRYEACTEAEIDIPFCQGYCYTQLTDVQQEINGLLERVPGWSCIGVRESGKPYGKQRCFGRKTATVE